jgi:hypothetical protein
MSDAGNEAGARKDGMVYVADRSDIRIQVFRQDGTLTLTPIVPSVAQGVDVMLISDERRMRLSRTVTGAVSRRAHP